MAGEGPGTARPAVRASIVDVARRAGVSVATVSRALRDMPNVSETTRGRVLAAATELRYSASPLASGLVTGRMRSVGVVMPYAGRWFFAEVVRGIEEALREAGYDLVLHVLADARRRRAFFEGLPLLRRVDAVLVVALPLEQEELAILRGLGLPLASVSESVAGVPADRIDDVAAARLATQHLVNLGHERIASIGGDLAGPGGRYSVHQRRSAGFREALEGSGLVLRRDWELDGRFTAAGGELAMTALLSQPGGRPTGVFCQSDEMAFGALGALRELGLVCPRDVSVVGLDGHELAATLDLTTVAQPVLDLGACAARWLVGHLADVDGDEDDDEDDDPDDGGPRLHAVRLLVRGSTAPPQPAAPAPEGAASSG